MSWLLKHFLFALASQKQLYTVLMDERKKNVWRFHLDVESKRSLNTFGCCHTHTLPCTQVWVWGKSNKFLMHKVLVVGNPSLDLFTSSNLQRSPLAITLACDQCYSQQEESGFSGFSRDRFLHSQKSCSIRSIGKHKMCQGVIERE